MEERLAQLLGVMAVAASDRLRDSVEAESAHGGSAPAALVHLQAYPGQPVESLRQVLGISQPATVRLVNRMVGEGLAERRPGPDRRSVALCLTDPGQAAATAVLVRRSQSLAHLLEVLDPAQRRALEPLLERLVAGLADDRRQALRVCRLCDRKACARKPGCPLDHTV